MKPKEFFHSFCLPAIIVPVLLGILLCGQPACAKKNTPLSLQTLKELNSDSVKKDLNIDIDSIGSKVIYQQVDADDINNIVEDALAEAGETDDSDNDIAGKAIAVANTASVMALMIPMLGIVTPFVFVIILTWLYVRDRASKRKERNALIELSLREHTPLPDSYFQLARPKTPTLSQGIIWIGCGIAAAMFMLCCNSEEMACLCLIPISIGIAKIVTYLVNNKEK